MLNFIDTHTHLFVEQFDSDRSQVVKRAQEAGIAQLLLPNIDVDSVAALKEMCHQFDVCLGMMGLHPCSVSDGYKSDLNVIEKELDQGDYCAVGEIGLDYYWDTTYKKEQLDAFRSQLIWAKDRNLPVAIHTRDSFEDAIQVVEEEQDGRLTGVFHCFGGSVDDGKRAIDMGFYLGIGGNSTFKKSSAPEVLPKLDLARIVLETDSPYLAPVPHRGKRNESSYVPLIAENLASIYGMSLEDISLITTQNAIRLFRL